MPAVKFRPLHKQVEEFVRTRIASGEFPEGSRFPSTAALAEMTGVSVFTAQTALSKLHQEGLLDRRANRETHVRGKRPVLTCAGIYLSRPLETRDFLFCQTLCQLLREALKREHVAVRIWADDRMESEQGRILLSLRRAIEKREIQAVIAPLIYGVDLQWLKKLEVASAVLGTLPSEVPATVGIESAQAMFQGLAWLKQQGCRRVALISGQGFIKDYASGEVPQATSAYYERFFKAVEEVGMTTGDAWVRSIPADSKSGETYGFDAFNRLWNNEEKPDALVVDTDGIVRGVLTALLARGVSVPGELKLLLHVNEEIAYPCPVPSGRLTVSVSEVAEALVGQIRNQLDGRIPEPRFLECRFKIYE